MQNEGNKLRDTMAEWIERAECAEDETKREECVKHFDFGENRYQAVIYPEPVHYRENARGKWLEIDNNLDEAEDASGRKVWKNRANALHAQFAQSTDEGALVSLEHGGHALAWSFDGMARGVCGAVRNGRELRMEKLARRAATQKTDAEEAETAEDSRMDRTEKNVRSAL